MPTLAHLCLWQLQYIRICSNFGAFMAQFAIRSYDIFGVFTLMPLHAINYDILVCVHNFMKAGFDLCRNTYMYGQGKYLHRKKITSFHHVSKMCL